MHLTIDTQPESTQKLTIRNSAEGQSLFGPHDTYIKIIEEATSVKTVMRGEEITVFGNKEGVDSVIHLLKVLLTLIRKGIVLTERDFRYAFDMAKEDRIDELIELYEEEIATTFKGKPIRVKTLGQRHYTTAVKKRDVVFGIGPAGTGKTYLAVVMAVMALKNGQVKRIVLTRPAVEAGENLGFLPGDLQEKVDPYLRPLYDGLNDVLGPENVIKFLERGLIEIAPLAYMRGRTLDEAFIILDEAQNTTPEQMKMFLTRLGFNSKMVITGDVTQIDLPKGRKSGLREAERVLKGIDEIGFIYLSEHDVVRHRLVQRIIQAYARDLDTDA